ncbi:sensor histidine kinase [Noviherbaspirillum sp. CPCC 100848]|uniref:histidine kinase n=1 Tax=Noviherbaspirillum album TaxID=3080276 RepID=A0ABU6JDG4_9BURK|nr:sensor histidine kinase [Noviherbaspirillum sp. CPCC 100848]MEC4721684.1 sensor histidine kinase [Noviherbaspirillum sp. CPCC 100848]
MTASIRSDLLKWLITPLVVINFIGALLIYMLAWGPAQNALDDNLAEAAYDLQAHLRLEGDRIKLSLSDQAERILRVNRTDEVFYVVRDISGDHIAGDVDFPAFAPYTASQRPVAFMSNIRHLHIRAVALRTELGGHLVWIGVAETLTKRRQIQSRILLALLGLETLLVVASLAIVWFAVSEGLFPLHHVRNILDKRSADDVSALDEKDMPAELRPLMGAINGLLGRVHKFGGERQSFLADIAHQLRTPLAGFKTQLEGLIARHRHDADVSRSAGLMMASADRMIRQTNQLLSLARAEPSQFEQRRMERVELHKLMAESIQHFVQEADKKAIDIGFELQPAHVMGDRFLLRDMIDNLVDNAIRYSGPSAVITVGCARDGDAVRVVVEDNGPGIPEADRENVFSRFFRLSDKEHGSGLGLAIVRDIAKDHRAEIALESGAGGKGTRVTVKFPALKNCSHESVSE